MLVFRTHAHQGRTLHFTDISGQFRLYTEHRIDMWKAATVTEPSLDPCRAHGLGPGSGDEFLMVRHPAVHCPSLVAYDVCVVVSVLVQWVRVKVFSSDLIR